MILKSDDILTAGEPYTFTYTGLSFLFLFQPSEQSVMDQLRPLMANFGDITGVSRGLFSSEWAITVIPKGDYALSDWLGETDPPGGFRYSFDTMGQTGASFVQAEGGTVSTKPGGVSQAISDTAGAVASTAGNTIAAAVKPLAPYLIIGAGALLAIEYMRGRE